MEKNAYFEEMRRQACAYSEAKEIRNEEKTAMMKADDWDGVRAFDERERREFPYPFTPGENRALRAYDQSLRNGADCFEVEDLPWDSELADFVETLRKAKVSTIVVTDQSTGLMDGIWNLVELGCCEGSLRIVTRADDHRFGSSEPERRRGIEFEIA